MQPMISLGPDQRALGLSGSQQQPSSMPRHPTVTVFIHTAA